jgi:Asp-tRNA(Asn)/Glu-tRNA(Gln) amidotransferase A subunit family amidase
MSRRLLALAAALTLMGTACADDTTATTTRSPTTTAAPATTGPPPPTTTTTAPPETTTAPTTTTVPLPPFDPDGAPILDIQRAMDEGRLTAVDLAAFSLERIEALEPGLNALITVSPDALTVAAALDAERAESGPRSPLHGIPIVLKDNIDTADMPTTAGSIALEGFVPPDDAAVVARLREAGAVIIGKANLHEWARTTQTLSSLGGLTINPFDADRNVGGSSGGTAVAVWSGMAVAGLGTDTCGSVRMPSSFLGLYGLRPTVGLVSTAGVIPLAPFEDTVGPMARTVEDLAIVLDGMAGEGEYLAAVRARLPRRPRIGVVNSLFGGEAVVGRTVRDALAALEANGATLVEVEVPNRGGLIGDAPAVLLREFRFALDEYLADSGAPVSSLAEIVDGGLFLPELRDRLLTHLSWGSPEAAGLDAARARRDPLREAVVAVMDENDLDALAYPAVGNLPAPVGTHQPGNNCTTASVAGLPALVIPAGEAEGFPVGLELLGRPFDEITLLQVAVATRG